MWAAAKPPRTKNPDVWVWAGNRGKLLLNVFEAYHIWAKRVQLAIHHEVGIIAGRPESGVLFFGVFQFY